MFNFNYANPGHINIVLSFSIDLEQGFIRSLTDEYLRFCFEMYKYLIKSPGRRELKNDESIRKQKMENAGGEVWKKKNESKNCIHRRLQISVCSLEKKIRNIN